MIQNNPRNYSHGFPPSYPQRNSPELQQEMPLRMRDRRDGHKLNMPMYLWVALTCVAVFAICYFWNADLTSKSSMHQSYSATTIPMLR